MSHSRQTLDFVQSLQSALTVEEIGTSYVAAVRFMIFARGHGIYRLDPQTNAFVDQAADVPSTLLDEYAAVGMGQDPVLEAAVHTGRPVDSSNEAVAETWPTSGAQQVLAHFGYAHSLKAPLVVGDLVWGSIHFTRYASDPPFDERDRKTAALLVKHLGAALTRAVRYEQVNWQASYLQAALDCVAQPVVVTDKQGDIMFTNAAARTTDIRGRQVLDLVGPTIHRATDLINNEGRRVVSTHVDAPEPTLLSVRTVAVPRYAATVSVIYARSDKPNMALPELGILSKREREIAQWVSQGLSTREIAARAFITENTVKQHLKRTFSKLGVNSRAEMVHAMWAAARAERI
ncbi:LuxR C-terminal-related transcriptional regulator [Rhodococcus sp. NPDC060176]|uniref:LuxR C-terminal-related transcriptional regulator n=1 Tax=Rhodococcus sp. NPDC060176 TaxID=3347062 RepID=UPI0036688678